MSFLARDPYTGRAPTFVPPKLEGTFRVNVIRNAIGAGRTCACKRDSADTALSAGDRAALDFVKRANGLQGASDAGMLRMLRDQIASHVNEDEDVALAMSGGGLVNFIRNGRKLTADQRRIDGEIIETRRFGVQARQFYRGNTVPDMSQEDARHILDHEEDEAPGFMEAVRRNGAKRRENADRQKTEALSKGGRG